MLGCNFGFGGSGSALGDLKSLEVKVWIVGDAVL